MMRLGEFIEHITEYVNINVYDAYRNTITDYDGKNSLDDWYNDFEIADFKIKNGLVEIELELDIGVMLKEIRDMIDRGDIEGARDTCEKAIELYTGR